jgi:hypothetical protein
MKMTFSELYHCLFFFCESLRCNTKPIIVLVIKNVATDVNIIADRSAAETSRSRYWYQGRSRAADRRCGAPPCLTTYSAQKIAVSRADSGRSLKALEIRTAFSRYLEQLRHDFKASEE